MMLVSSMMRSSPTVIAICAASVKPGARTCGTNHGAASQITAETAVISSKTMLAIEAARRQAPASSSRARKVAKVGMKADASAPPAIRLNRISVSRLAALNASSSGFVPNAREISIVARMPMTLESAIPIMTTLVARAIRRAA